MTEYKISFTPGRYYVAPAASFSGKTEIPYFNIIDESTRLPVAFAFTENMAQTVCFSLDLINSMIEGDGTRAREMMAHLEKLKKAQA